MKNKHLFRTGWNKLLQGGIRLCMLSAVAFTVTACYGLPPDDYRAIPPDMDSIQQDQQRQEIEKRMADIAKQIESNEADETDDAENESIHI